jgi:endonuclease G
MLISKTKLDNSAQRYAALDDKTARENISKNTEEVDINNVPKEIKGNILSTDENLAKRKEMLENISQEPVDFALERAIGENDSVYSNFVELIGNAKQKVGRVYIKSGIERIGFAKRFRFKIFESARRTLSGIEVMNM